MQHPKGVRAPACLAGGGRSDINFVRTLALSISLFVSLSTGLVEFVGAVFGSRLATHTYSPASGRKATLRARL